MHGVRFYLPLICLCSTSVVGNARQVDLQKFHEPGPPSSMRLFATDRNSVEGALVEMFESMHGVQHLAATGQDPEQPQIFRPTTRECTSSGYSPTWWLPAEVEQRRAIYLPQVAAISCEFRLPIALLDAVIAQESGYNAFATSSAGAMGMMQIMPSTAQRLGLTRPWDPFANMRAGARYLRQQIDRFGRVDLALAAYNAGPERRSLRAGYIPAIPETMTYVRTITTNWARLTQLTPALPAMSARAEAASLAVRAAGYREVTLSIYDGINASNPI